jgi:hypothetical protein
VYICCILEEKGRKSLKTANAGVRLLAAMKGSGEGGCDVTYYRSLPRGAELCGCVATFC